MDSDSEEETFDNKKINLIDLANHLFLLKRLPQAEEANIVKIELDILQQLINASDPLLKRKFPKTFHTLKTWFDLQSQSKSKFLDKTLSNLKQWQSACLYIRKQNCTIVFTKLSAEYMRIITFRASLPNGYVIGTCGSLKVTYPETVEVVPISSILLSPCFSRQIKKLVSKSCSIAMPRTQKARVSYEETREPSNPYVISDFLVGMLCPVDSGKFGKVADKSELEFEKKLRDQVNWSQSDLPFRRSGLWMSAKVVLQLSLQEEMETKAEAHVMFKIIILNLLTNIAEEYIKLDTIFWDISAQIMAKLARRAKKLSELKNIGNTDLQMECQKIIDRSLLAIDKIYDLVSKQWEHTISSHSTSLEITPVRRSKQDWGSDCIHFMDELAAYLNKENISNATEGDIDNLKNIDPIIQTRTVTLESLLVRIQGSTSEQQDVHLNDESTWLYQVEWFVRYKLNTSHSCEKIFQLMSSYFQKAFPLYRTTYADPVNYSKLTVTVLKFLAVLDEIAVKAHPLLKRYKTGVKPEMFDRLLLPEKSEMELLESLQQYFAKRNSEAMYVFWLSSRDIDELDFPVQFAQDDPKMQLLKQQILIQTESDIKSKKWEIENTKTKCKELQEKINGLSCTYTWHSFYEKNIHDRNCRRCSVSSELTMRRTSVGRYQRRLPPQEHLRDAVVFELIIPNEISILRDATGMLLEDILDLDSLLFSPKLEAKCVHTNWMEFNDVTNWKSIGHMSSYQMGSPFKSTMASHYGNSNPDVLLCSDDSFILENGLHCKYFRVSSIDKKPESPFTMKIIEAEKKEAESYQSVQFALNIERPTENEVISRQYMCHQNITLKEFKVFGSIRSAHLVQLRNLYAGIASKVLSLEKEPVLQMVMQALWEVGPGKRDIHVDFELEENKPFVFAFLELLKTVGEQNATNWSKPTVFLSLTVLAFRILEMTECSDVKELVSTTLQGYRGHLEDWCVKLEQLLLKKVDEKDSKMLRKLLLSSAMCCMFTFNVSKDECMPYVLKDSVDITTYLKMLSRLHHLAIRENILNVFPPSRFVQNMLRHARYIIPLNLYEHLHKILVQSKFNHGIHYFVCSKWFEAKKYGNMPNFVSSSGYMSSEKSHAYQATYDTHKVCVDILRGTFFVDGYPPSVLPEKITRNPLYKSFFRTSQFRVQRDSQTFKTTDQYRGHHFEFSEVPAGLIIRQLFTDDHCFELLCPNLLQEKVPHDLIQNYTHWYGSETKMVYFRGPSASETEENIEDDTDYVLIPKLEDASCLSEEWHLKKYIGSPPKSSSLTSIKSTGFDMITENLQKLEKNNFIHIFMEPQDGLVRANLWRLNLSFSLNQTNGLLYCDNYPGYYIPTSGGGGQCLGTLIGLQNGIVLEKPTQAEPSGRKKVFIIQHGTVSISQGCNHQSVNVTVDEIKSPSYFVFEVDQVLKRLRPGKNRSAWLYLALLHGATSSPFPDPFTQLTGTEMAMWILQSAFSWSCSPHDEPCIKILQQIAVLSPKYNYYPQHLKVMQITEWPEGLSRNSYAAYDGYFLVVQKLLDDSLRIEGLFPEIQTEEMDEVETKVELCRRSYQRNINFYNKSAHLSNGFIENQGIPAVSQIIKLSSRLHQGEISDLETLANSRNQRILSTNPAAIFPFIMTDALLPFEIEDKLVYESILSWLDTKLRKNWLQLYSLALNASKRDLEHELTLILGAILYSSKDPNYPKVKSDVVNQLLNLHNISISNDTGFITFPEPMTSLTGQCYNPKNHEFDSCEIITTMKSAADEPPSEGDFKTFAEYTKAKNEYEKSLKQQLALAAHELMSKYWPTEKIDSSSLRQTLSPKPLLNFNSEELEHINMYLKEWYNNLKLKQFILSVDEIMGVLKNGHLAQDHDGNWSGDWGLCFHTFPDTADKWWKVDMPPDSKAMEIFKSGKVEEHTISTNFCHKRNEYLELISDFTQKLENIMLSNRPVERGLKKAGLYSRLVPIILLRDQFGKPGNSRTNEYCYVGALAVLWTHIKRLNRLIMYESDKDKYSVEMTRELETQQCENWNPLDNPEWTLLELELDITIRQIQVCVARRMMKMPDGKNGVMQLNMGEGKTTVIIPMIVASLSYQRDLLCRVTVLNSIYATNYNLLASTIGGFLNKRLYSIPCSRAHDIGKYIEQIQNIYEECQNWGGAVITLPEYRLSFRLQMYNKFLNDKLGDLGLKIHRTESWLRKYARDLVDESDEIFSVKYQLIYTTGKQLPIDGGNMRWTVCQKLLEFLPQITSEFPKESIEFEKDAVAMNPEKFSHLRFLNDDCKEDLNEKVADGILNGRINLIGGILAENEKKIVKEFLINEDISEENHKKLSEVEISEEKREILLLVSGYLRRGILYAALKKRWRVDYGVRQSREGENAKSKAVPSKAKDVNAEKTKSERDGENAKLMAVPFRAKDVAAERTEFGHPDMAIVLTQLSYYYSGLSDEQLYQCFHILETAITGPEAVYNSWIQKIPSEKIKSETVKSYKGINLQDYEQRTTHLFPLLRRHKSVVDFWLENVAFPKESKQFPCKLVTNAWDLCYEKCEHPTTGFSGTNDTSLLLPAQITQQDLQSLSETNVRMEETLRGNENQWRRSMKMGVGCEEVLKCMIKDELRVLIDAGALMLDLGNEEIAKLWLDLDKSLEAIMYFNEDGEMVVKVRLHTEFQKRSKQVKDQQLTLSPYKDHLENCGIYLDDQHTRGTDIKLPTNFKACVTVGSNMQRDKLIQACMRMRKLGKGQSVHFYLSHEVDTKIRGIMNSSQRGMITVNDVITWTKQNSRQFEMDGLVYWTTNAKYYAKNIASDELFELSNKSKDDGKKMAERCQDPDAQKLQIMYGTYHHRVLVTDLIPKWFGGIKLKLKQDGLLSLPEEITKIVNDIEAAVSRKCKEHIPETTFFHSMLEEEQEKELEPEQERERQIDRPSAEDPLEPELHRNVTDTVTKRNQVTRLLGISRLSDIFRHTTIRSTIQNHCWGNYCFATDDFINVIESNSNENNMDCFLRSIQFFVSFRNGGITTVLLLSIHEVNQLISHIREKKCSQETTLHMFSGSWMEGQPIFANDSRLQLPIRTMHPAESLGGNVLSQLQIASGNLYFSGIEEAKAFTKFLGLRPRPWTEDEEKAFQDKQITNTGFVKSTCTALRDGCEFQNDPTGMAMGILKIRNDVLRDEDHTVSILKNCSTKFHTLEQSALQTDICD